MRICLLNLWHEGGMLHYASQLANSLASLPGLEVIIILPCSARSAASELFAPAVRIEYIDVLTEAKPDQMLTLPGRLLHLIRFLALFPRVRADVVHVLAAHPWLVMMLPVLKISYPIVSTLHDVTPHPGRDDTLRKRLEIATMIALSDAFIVHGQKLKAELLSLKPRIPADRVHVIPHGDYAFFRRWEAGHPEEPETILFFGRLRAYKGLGYLLDAFEQIVKVRSTARLIVAGEGDTDGAIKRLQALPNCEVHDRFIPDAEVSALFERASIVACPYVEASQSGIIPIAYAFRKPVVATWVGCLPDVIDDGITGLLVPPRDSEALAQAMLTLLQDDQLRQHMGQNAYLKMQRELGWDGIAHTTIDVYKTLTGKTSHLPS